MILETREITNTEYWIVKGIFEVAKLFVEVSPAVSIGAGYELSSGKKRSDAQAGKFLQIPYADIEKFDIVKSFNLPAAAKVFLKHPPQDLDDDGLVFMIGVVPHRKVEKRWGYRSPDFVEIGNRFLVS